MRPHQGYFFLSLIIAGILCTSGYFFAFQWIQTAGSVWAAPVMVTFFTAASVWIVFMGSNAGRHQEGKVENTILIPPINHASQEIKMLSWATTKTASAVLICDPQDRVVWVNAGFSEITGFTFEECRNNHISFLRGKGTNPLTVREIQNRLKEKKPFFTEILNYKKDGTEIWFSLNVTPVLNEKNEVTSSITLMMDVTEHIRLEHHLEDLLSDFNRTQSNLSLLIENVRDSFWSVDANYKIIALNSYCVEECKNIFGTDAKPGSHLDEFVPKEKFPEMNNHWREIFERVLGGEFISEELTQGDKDNRRNYVISYAPIRTGSGISGISIFSKEISEIKKVGAELKAANSLLSATFESSNEGFLAVDKNGKIMNLNRTFAEMWKIPKDILESKNDGLALQHVIDQLKNPPAFIEKVNYLYSHPEEESYDLIEFLDGKVFERYSASLKINEENAGRLWTFRDVTRRVEFEKELNRATLEAYDLYNNAPCGYHSVDQYGVFLAVNDTELEWLGYTREEMVGKMTIFDLVPEEQKDFLKKNFDQLLKGETIMNEEVELVRKDGFRIPVLKSTTPVMRPDKTMERTRSTIYNIDYRKKIEKELVEANRLSENALKFREQFVANVSHEIRTPMSGISGMINLLLETPLDKEQREYLNALKNSTDNILVILNDILDISKIDAGQINIDEFEFRLDEVVDSVMGLLKPRSREKKLELGFSKSGKIPSVLIGDPVRLNQILMNLLNNSIKFTEKGSIRLTMENILNNAGSAWIRFVVTDTGIGIPEDKFDTIFESFAQAGRETASKYGGSGLGLAIVKKLVDIQQGTIKVESTVGKGTTFKVDLPFKLPIHKGIETHEKREDDHLVFDQARVLLVEDNSVNVLLTRKILQQWGIEPDLAENGKICIEKAKLKNYDLILMDIQMPELNGYDATSFIRNQFSYPKNKVGIIAMTARTSIKERTYCIQAGMDDYIAKPFKKEQLLQKIIPFLEKRIIPNPMNHKKQPESVPESPVIDLSYLIQVAEGSNEFIVEMIRHFLKKTPQAVWELGESLREGNWEQIRNISHRIRPGMGFMGIQTLIGVLETIEDISEKKSDPGNLKELIQQVTDVSMKAFSQLEAELEKLEGKEQNAGNKA